MQLQNTAFDRPTFLQKRLFLSQPDLDRQVVLDLGAEFLYGWVGRARVNDPPFSNHRKIQLREAASRKETSAVATGICDSV